MARSTETFHPPFVTRVDTCSRGQASAKGVHMESVIVACVTGVVTLVGVLASNSKYRIDKSMRVGGLTAGQGNARHREGCRA